MMAHVLQMRGMRKSYDAVAAVQWSHDSAITMNAGTIMGLAGENGAGKSTLLGAMTGSVTLDAGEVLLNGAPYNPTGPFDALAQGVALIPQETLLCPTLSVADNVLMGRERHYSRYGFINTRRRDELAQQALDSVELDINPRTLCGVLPLEVKKMIELARALAAHPHVLLVDETSNVLSRDGVTVLFDRIHTFAAQGGVVIVVTHRLDEIIHHCTEVTILKDGAVVGTYSTSDITEDAMAHAMVGRAVELGIGDMHQITDSSPGCGDVILEASNLRAPGCGEFSLTVRKGEIVGIGGLVGCGADIIGRTLAGAIPATGGTIRVGQRDVTRSTLRQRITAGIGYVPKDRDEEGLLLGASILDNITLASVHRYSRMGWVPRHAGKTVVEKHLRALSMNTSVHAPVHTLSGGNRQKVLLARWLHDWFLDLAVLIVDNPTRGVDIGAKSDIYRILNAARRRGQALIIISDELPELLRVADRVLIMRRGEVSAQYRRPLPTEPELLEAMLL